MTAPNYKDGGSWTAIPEAAIYGTHPGNYYVKWPAAADFDGAGAPCGAVGLPEIVIETAWLTDDGMDFWRDRFASSADESAALSIEAFDPRTGTNVKWLGTLHRPTWQSLGPGGSAGTTIYRGVQISITDCAVTT